jgi:short-subunit dehydrogenase
LAPRCWRKGYVNAPSHSFDKRPEAAGLKHGYRSIVISGASSGIGRALALELASDGCAMLLIGRNLRRLQDVAEKAGSAGADVRIARIDVRDAAAMSHAILDFDTRHPVDLVVANAGVARGLSRDLHFESGEQMCEVMETNLDGAFNTVTPLLPHMAERRRGQIALMSSLAAIRPSGDLPAYSASKAALVAWGVALRRRLRGVGVTVSIVTPGFVETPMSERHRGPRPLRIGDREAARQIVQGLRKRRARISVPRLAALLVRLENLLPASLADRIERCFAADIADSPPEPDFDPQESDEKRLLPSPQTRFRAESGTLSAGTR